MLDKYKNLNEFQWEAEFKKEDKRINTYFKELSDLVDLPGESKIIKKRTNNNQPGLLAKILDPDPELTDFDIPESFDSELGEEKSTQIFQNLSKEATEFSKILAPYTNQFVINKGLRILCVYGKLISIILDFSEVEENTAPSLKIALSKRILSYLNDLVGYLEDFKKVLPQNSHIVKKQKNKLFEVRDYIIETSYSCKSKQ